MIVVLEKRSDDTEETFKKRYQTYLDSTSPIINYYKQKGILESINVMRTQNEVAKDILSVINDENVSVKRRKSD